MSNLNIQLIVTDPARAGRLVRHLELTRAARPNDLPAASARPWLVRDGILTVSVFAWAHQELVDADVARGSGPPPTVANALLIVSMGMQHGLWAVDLRGSTVSMSDDPEVLAAEFRARRAGAPGVFASTQAVKRERDQLKIEHAEERVRAQQALHDRDQAIAETQRLQQQLAQAKAAVDWNAEALRQTKDALETANREVRQARAGGFTPSANRELHVIISQRLERLENAVQWLENPNPGKGMRGDFLALRDAVKAIEVRVDELDAVGGPPTTRERLGGIDQRITAVYADLDRRLRAQHLELRTFHQVDAPGPHESASPSGTVTIGAHLANLAADMLLDYNIVLSRNSCNDWSFPESWTDEQRRNLVRGYNDWNEHGPNEQEDVPPDFGVAAYLADVLRSDGAEGARKFGTDFTTSTGRVIGDVQAARRKAIAAGCDAAHDDEHDDGSLADGACVLAAPSAGQGPKFAFDRMKWAWALRAKRDRRGQLIEAIQLLVAEVERLDRQTARRIVEEDDKARSLPSESGPEYIRVTFDAGDAGKTDVGVRVGERLGAVLHRCFPLMPDVVRLVDDQGVEWPRHGMFSSAAAGRTFRLVNLDPPAVPESPGGDPTSPPERQEVVDRPLMYQAVVMQMRNPLHTPALVLQRLGADESPATPEEMSRLVHLHLLECLGEVDENDTDEHIGKEVRDAADLVGGMIRIGAVRRRPDGNGWDVETSLIAPDRKNLQVWMGWDDETWDAALALIRDPSSTDAAAKVAGLGFGLVAADLGAAIRDLAVGPVGSGGGRPELGPDEISVEVPRG